MTGKANTSKGRPTPRQGRAGGAAASEPGVPTGDFEATPASGWRSTRRMGIPVTLPSGNQCRLRRTFGMLNMLESDTIPNPLSMYLKEAVEEAQGATGDGKGVVQISDMIDEESDEGKTALVQFLDMMMKAMSDIFVEPRVLQIPAGENPRTWEPGYRTVEGEEEPQLLHPEEQGAISVADLDASDQMYAFNFAQGGVGSMAPFRNEKT